MADLLAGGMAGHLVGDSADRSAAMSAVSMVDWSAESKADALVGPRADEMDERSAECSAVYLVGRTVAWTADRLVASSAVRSVGPMEHLSADH